MIERKKSLDKKPLISNIGTVAVAGTLTNYLAYIKESKEYPEPISLATTRKTKVAAGDILALSPNDFDIVTNIPLAATPDTLLTTISTQATSSVGTYMVTESSLTFACSTTNNMRYCKILIVGYGSDGESYRWVDLTGCTDTTTLSVTFTSTYIDLWICAPAYTTGSYSNLLHYTAVEDFNPYTGLDIATSSSIEDPWNHGGFYRICASGYYSTSGTSFTYAIGFTGPTTVGGATAIGSVSTADVTTPMNTYIPLLYKTQLPSLRIVNKSVGGFYPLLKYHFIGSKTVNRVTYSAYIAVSSMTDTPANTPIYEEALATVSSLIPTTASVSGATGGVITIA